MPDTGEDNEVTLDTTPIRGAAMYWSGSELVAPDTIIHFASDGDVRVPAQSEDHARDLATAISMVELEHFGSTGWLSRARRLTIRLMKWLNDRDPRTLVF